MRTPVGTSIRSATLPCHTLMAASLILVALVVYWPSSVGLWVYRLQAGEATQYGLIIAALSVRLLLRSRGALAAAPVKPVPWALPVLVALSVGSLLIGYARQTQGHELVNEGNFLIGKHGLTVVDYALVSAAGEDFRGLTVRDSSGRHSLIWWVYDIGGRRFATPIYSELWYGFEALSRPPYSFLYAFRTSCEPSCQAARGRLKRFMERNGAGLFTAARESRSTSVENPA